jgi:asparagine synthase (glutamine-hydrolysing)
MLPSKVVDRRKGYFPVPALKYLRGRALDLVCDTLRARQARERGLFNADYVEQLIAAPEDHITPLRGSKLWQVATLEMWLQANNIGAEA